MCFNPSPVRRVPSPNRYIAVAKFCFCKNNKRLIDLMAVAVEGRRQRGAVVHFRGFIVCMAVAIESRRQRGAVVHRFRGVLI